MKDVQAQGVLVFPAIHPAGQAYIEMARERGERVVAASSDWDANLAEEFGELIVFPYVNEQTFPDCFLALIRERNITSVYAPVAAVHAWLVQFISENHLAIRLIGLSPIKQELRRFNKLMGVVEKSRRFIDDCSDHARDLTNLEIAAVFRMAGNIYGESNEQKIAAMIAIFASSPQGDVIEIGSLVGRSAAVLAFLSRKYQIGNVLAVDPWRSEASVQHGSPSTVRQEMVNEWDFEMLPQCFIVNMLPLGLGSFNYLRQESASAFEMFRGKHFVESQAFGRVEYQGKIAVLHIDGNHDYLKVKQDCDLWLQLMAPDGWLILDDYIWAHGDGPRRVGDALLLHLAMKIERAFVCGKALFIKFGG